MLSTHPFLVLITLAFAGVVAWRAWMLRQASGTPADFGTLAVVPVGALVAAALAAVIGRVISGPTGRGASAGFGVVLLAAVGLVGFSNYTLSSRGNPSPASITVTNPLDLLRAPARVPGPASAEPRARATEPAPAIASSSPFAPSAAGAAEIPPPAPTTPSPSGDEDPNLPTTAPVAKPIPEAPASPAFADVAAWLALKEPRGAPALVPLAAELDRSVAGIIEKADALTASLGKPGRPSNRALDERIALADAGKQLADALAERCFHLTDEATKLVKSYRGDVTAIAFAQQSNAGARFVAAQRFAAFFEAASHQGALLRHNPSKWSLARDGTIETKDAQLRADLNAPTFTIDTFLREQPEARQRLEGR